MTDPLIRYDVGLDETVPVTQEYINTIEERLVRQFRVRRIASHILNEGMKMPDDQLTQLEGLISSAQAETTAG